MRIRPSALAVASLFTGILAAHAAPLAITEVSAPDINCKFDASCKVVVEDTASHFTLPGTTGDAFLQSRTWPVGKPGTAGAGLTAYLYRIDLRQLAGLTVLPCVNQLTVDFGPVSSLDYDGDGTTEQVFAITEGGLGTVRPSAARQSGTTVTFDFAPPVCAGASVGSGQSSYFFGLASVHPPQAVTASIRDTLGSTHGLAARAPTPSGTPLSAIDRARMRPEIVGAWQQFNAAFGDRWRVQWNPRTGTPGLIDGHAAALAGPLERETIEPRTREFLARLVPVFKVETRDLALGRVDFQAPKNRGAGSGTWYVAYRQTYRGLPVFDGSVRLTVSDAKLVSIRAQLYPGIDRPIEPKVALERAVAAVSPAGVRPQREQLVIFPRAAGTTVQYHLAWEILMPLEKAPYGSAVTDPRAGPKDDRLRELVPVQWRYIVDADTGAILERRNVIDYEEVQGTVTGPVHPNAPADAAVTQPIAHMRVEVQQGAITPSAETDATGTYHVPGLAAGTGTLTGHFTGAHVQVFNDETPDPDATHTSSVAVPGTHDWDWSVDDPSPNHVETNTFYHVNRIRDWFLRGTPFDVAPEPDPMTVHVRNGAYCNASAGGSGLNFGSGTASCQDFAMCSDIVYHEYTHRIVHAVYDGSGVDLYATEERGAMNEAFADFFGGTLTNDSSNGEGCYTGRNFDTPNHRYPDDWVGEVHYDGIIFSGALWDLRAALPIDYVDSIALRAMKRTPGDYTDYLAAVLEEDDDPAHSTNPAAANNNPADGTPNIDAICHAYFDLHGIFHPYCAGHTQGPVAIITLPDPRTFNLYGASIASITIEGSALAGTTSPFGHYVLEYAAESASSTWLTAGMTLTGGGTAPVAGGTLGTLALAGLADGVYIIRLTAFDASGASASMKTTIDIDRSLKAGWPQASGVHFYGTPAVADLDPSVAGLEIVAAGSDGSLYAWHSDGTAVPGWPKVVGYTTASPAVADLDGNGTLEVVIAAWSSVFAYHQDGTPVTGWPKSAGAQIRGTTALADLDGDGKLEIIAASTTQVFAWHDDGTAVAGWPQTVAGASEVSTSAALGDLDGDGLPEVIVATADFTSWSGNKVMAWHHDGTAVTGWPQNLPTISFAPASVGLADIDGDGVLEVVVMSNDDNINVFHGDGTALAGWPPAGPGFMGYEFTVSSPSIADLDGDGNMDVVADASYKETYGFRSFKVYAFQHDGAPVAGWPKAVSSYSNSSPTIADLDGDGHTEVIMGSDGIFVWTLPGTFDRNGAEWPTYRHDNQRTGAYLPKAGVVLLFDTSGSMSWRPDGTMGVPAAEQRITFAKQAAIPFLEELNDFNSGKALFGIATFPLHPSGTYPYSCNAQVVTPMTVITDASKNTAVSTTIPGLVTDDNTPLLAGMSKAAGMLGGQRNAAIVLLSDGYHNCPSFASVGDPAVTSLIASLNARSIRVFSIGFGRPTDPDYPLLEGFANQTTPAGYAGSQFYDVTTPGFDPATWHPATALQATYKSILVDALGLQAAIDPLGTISGGGHASYNVRLNALDRRVSFFLSWKTAQRERLQLGVKASDGTVVPTVGRGIRSHLGETYAILTVDASFLTLPGKVGAAPWTMEVNATGLPAGQSEPYQYSVILDSALRFDPRFDRPVHFAGDKLLVTARLFAAARPLPRPASVVVEVARPSEGLGNWLARQRVTAEELRRIPERRGTEILQPFERKAIYLQEIRKVKPPDPKFDAKVTLYDDGTHGDAKAGDGIYSAEVAATKPGVYSFHFHADAQGSKGDGFDRDRVMQTYVAVNALPELAQVNVVRLDARRLAIVVKPQDAQGNLLGPGHAARLHVKSSMGKPTGGLVDALDGTYRQVITLPQKPAVKELKLVLSIDGRTARLTRPVRANPPEPPQ